MDKSWINLGTRVSKQYQDGIKEFMKFAYRNRDESELITCPCRKCVNRPTYLSKVEVFKHLEDNGFLRKYTNWIHHGEPVMAAPNSCSEGEVNPRIEDDMIGMLHEAMRIPDVEVGNDQRGKRTIHKTDRKHFVQVRYEMEKDGEKTDKFSVWKKTCDLEDANVKELIVQYEKCLSEETLEDQQKNIVKDKLFHYLMGDDGHGYCRTFGSLVSRSLIYAKKTPSFQTTDLITNITTQVCLQVQGEIDEL